MNENSGRGYENIVVAATLVATNLWMSTMRPEPNLRVDNFRRVHPALGSSPAGANWGYFVVGQLRIISSGTPDMGESEWEHVSVSVADRCPTWEEMCDVKELFWAPEETVMQFHPKRSKYVNKHPYCLHLWKPVGDDVRLPPANLIA